MPPRVSKEEFACLVAVLADKGFDQKARDRVREIFMGDLNEDHLQDGIDAKEIERTMTWLRANKTKHILTDKQLDILETELKERL